MNRFYKILRAVIVTVIAMTVTVLAVVYVGLSLPAVQNRLAGVACSELSGMSGADVEIGSLTISPFNRAMIRDIAVTLDDGRDTVMTVDRLGAGINLYELMVNRQIVINYVEVVGLDLRVGRDSIGAPLNIQPLIDRLSPRDDNKPKSDITLAVNTVVLRNARLSYDVGREPDAEPGVFSPHHVAVSDFSADLRIPSVGNARQLFEIKRFRLREASGLEVTDMSGFLSLTPDSLSWKDVRIGMSESRILLVDSHLDNPEHLSPGELFLSAPLTVGIADGSYVTPSDLSPLLPLLSRFDNRVSLALDINGVVSEECTVALSAKMPDGGFGLEMSGVLSHPLDSMFRLSGLHLMGHVTTDVLGRLPLEPAVQRLADAAEYLSVTLDGMVGRDAADVDGTVATARGNLGITGRVEGMGSRSPRYDLGIVADRLELGKLLRNDAFDMASFNATASGRIIGGRPDGEAEINIDRLDWNGHRLGDVTAALVTSGKNYDIRLSSLDPAVTMDVVATGEIDRHFRSMDLTARMDYIDIGELVPGNRYGDCVLSLSTDASLSGTSVDDITGWLNVHDIQLDRPDGGSIVLNGMAVELSGDADDERRIGLESDLISGSVSGNIYLSTLGRQLKSIAMTSLPALAGDNPAPAVDDRPNSFDYRLTLHDTEKWADALKLPVSNLGESHIDGGVDFPSGSMSLSIDAPYLRQGNKLVEKTRVDVFVAGDPGVSSLGFTSRFPTKHGQLQIDFDNKAADDSVDSRLRWSIDRVARYDGDLSVSAALDRQPGGVGALVTIHPGELTFNDSTWTVNGATVDVQPGQITVNGINAHRSGQFVKIDGRASHLPEDAITIDLLGVNLDYIFESLGIDKVMLGGDATGRFYLSDLFSREPRLETPGLSVKAISYNKVVLGDALVKSRWNMEKRAITLDAVVDQPGGDRTLIDGAIFPLNDSLDITFDAHNVDVGFMYPYMSAFASEVSGHASGKARLWGNFKYIDMEGDIAGDNLKIKIAFTNTTYTTSDTVRLRLGEISLKNMTIRDMYGNRAVLDGKVWHKYFKEPVFDFSVTDAHNLLVYDESSRQNPDWYGSIYGNGSAHIDGRPGVVNIKVDMATAPGSVFTFVLNDMEEANDYTFITFRDRDIVAFGEGEQLVDDTPGTVRRLREMLAKREEVSSSAYNIDLEIDINPDAAINLVMDPVGGDRIRSRGVGSMRMTYGSVDNELHMYGSYVLERGDYNFTLQDIIIKDFTIKPGSSISFTGDPFSAELDIKAAYPLTANLSDLDESFLHDKDLNRTTVPVNAILKVSGFMQQPDIDFDLEFPTVTQDTYRKVKSIVSTEEMMNRQIIYLLALGRFYTPDYMASATRGNELVSVASSTISSQLGNILGSISDNWNIAPSFRSDRGDFSDVEVDVALSSSLLNNRLLFNGNFGYRDKSLNNTQFVGDFDIEYLLNRAGTIRLKAYNRYNDMNYYVRTAETTQGVGVSYRRNFDNLTELIRRQHRKERRAAAADSIPESISK